MMVAEVSLSGNMRPSASVCRNICHLARLNVGIRGSYFRSRRWASDEEDGAANTPTHLEMHTPLLKPPGSVRRPVGAEKSAPQLLVAARILFGQELRTECKSWITWVPVRAHMRVRTEC